MRDDDNVYVYGRQSVPRVLSVLSAFVLSVSTPCAVLMKSGPFGGSVECEIRVLQLLSERWLYLRHY
jgi:hypothetical protein